MRRRISSGFRVDGPLPKVGGLEGPPIFINEKQNNIIGCNFCNLEQRLQTTGHDFTVHPVPRSKRHVSVLGLFNQLYGPEAAAAQQAQPERGGREVSMFEGPARHGTPSCL